MQRTARLLALIAFLVSVAAQADDAAQLQLALKKLTVVATGEVFTANIRDQERPGLE